MLYLHSDEIPAINILMCCYNIHVYILHVQGSGCVGGSLAGSGWVVVLCVERRGLEKVA